MCLFKVCLAYKLNRYHIQSIYLIVDFACRYSAIFVEIVQILNVYSEVLSILVLQRSASCCEVLNFLHDVFLMIFERGVEDFYIEMRGLEILVLGLVVISLNLDVCVFVQECACWLFVNVHSSQLLHYRNYPILLIMIF